MTRCSFGLPSYPGVSRRWSILFLSLGLLVLANLAHAQGTSTQRNPTATFASPGTKQVTLTACNAVDCTSMTRNVVVLDPRPSIASLSIPTIVGLGQTVTLQATTAGRPPRNHRWILSAVGVADTVVTGNPASWTAPSAAAVYLARLEVTSSDGSATSAPVTVNVVPSTFEDVPPTYWAWRFIENMQRRGISSGCSASPRLYCPEANVTRGEMAVLLLRSKEGAAYVPPACVTPRFADVPCSHPQAAWINELVVRGVTAGCDGSNYCPTLAVNRAQMAVFLLVTNGVSPVPCPPTVFSDVSSFSPFCPWIKEIAARGITAGCGGGAYCGSNPVNQAQMAIFLSVAFNIPPL